jgi:hypothetical protein
VCRLDEAKQELVNESLGIAFPIMSGIPILIPRKAFFLSSEAVVCIFLRPARSCFVVYMARYASYSRDVS